MKLGSFSLNLSVVLDPPLYLCPVSGNGLASAKDLPVLAQNFHVNSDIQTVKF